MAAHAGHGGTHFTSRCQLVSSTALKAGVVPPEELGEAGELPSAGKTAGVPLAFSGAGASRLAAARGRELRVMVAATLDVDCAIKAPHGEHDVNALAFDGTGAALVSGGGDGAVRVWHMPSGEMTAEYLREGGAACTTVAFGTTRNEPFVAAGYADGQVWLWSWEGEHLAALQGHAAAVLCVDISRDGSLVATASADGTARVWRIKDCACVAVLRDETPCGDVSCARFGAARTRDCVVTACGDGAARAYKLPKDVRGSGPSGDAAPVLLPYHRFKGHTEAVRSLSVGENGEVLATASEDRSVKLWTMRDGELARHVAVGRPMRTVVFSTAGAPKLAGASTYGAIRVWGIPKV